jgi:hypothetical protein
MHDITIDTHDFMLVPGSYRAQQDGIVDSRLLRQRLTDFSTGQAHSRPTRSGEARGGLLAGLGAWPAPWPIGGEGIAPGPAAQAVAGSITSSEPKLTVSDRDYLFIVAGTTVYRWNRAIGTAPVNRKTLAASAAGAVRLDNALYVSHGSGTDVSRYDDASNTLTASALGAGVRAGLIGGFSRGIVLVHPSFPMNLHMYYGNSLSYVRTWKLDGRIVRFTQHGDRMIVATDAGLFELSGNWYQDSDPPAPPETLRVTSWGTLSGQLQDSDDFAWMTVYQGRLMAWLGKRVVIYDEARNWWRHAGLEGGGTSGAAVVNGWLLTTVSPRGAPSTWQLWGYSGSGWWLLHEASGTNTLSTPSADGGGKLVTFTASAGTLQARDLDDSSTATTLASPISVTTPLLDAGEPDRRKYWRRAGIELDRPDGHTTGEWTFTLAWSTDSGATFTAAGTSSVTGPRASVEFPVGASGSSLVLRVTATRVSGLPPAITAIWAEHETLNDSVRRRRWQFKIHARPRSVDRDGMLDPRTGQDMRAALWQLWEATEATRFRDVDYATTGAEHTVRLIGIREEWPKPADEPALGADTVIELTIVEV